MKIFHVFLALTITAVTLVANVNATTLQFEKTFDFSNATNNNSGRLDVVTLGDFTADLPSFNGGLGELVSFKVDWNIDFLAEGNISDNGGNAVSQGISGTYSINRISYSGNGSGFGSGSNGAAPYSETTNVSKSNTFNVVESGLSFDPKILDAVTSGITFQALWDTTFSVNFIEFTDIFASAKGNVSVTYDYKANVKKVPAPAVWLILILGLAGISLRKNTHSR